MQYKVCALSATGQATIVLLAESLGQITVGFQTKIWRNECSFFAISTIILDSIVNNLLCAICINVIRIFQEKYTCFMVLEAFLSA